MAIRNNDGTSFQSFRSEREGLRAARHESDPAVFALIEDTQHELF